MNAIIPSMLLLLFAVLGGACKTTEGSGPDAASAASMERTLVDKHIDAKGGRTNLGAVESMKMVGTVFVSSAGMTLPLTMYKKRPAKMLIHVDVPQAGMEVKSGYDGETAWTNNPMMGGLQKVTGEQAQNFKEQADIDGILVDYASKGYSVEYVGEAEVEGRPAQKLRVIRPDSSEVFVYLDAESLLQVKSEGKGVNPMNGSRVNIESFTSDHREVGGVMVPFAIEMKIDGATFQEIKFREVQVNEEVKDQVFAYPGK